MQAMMSKPRHSGMRPYYIPTTREAAGLDAEREARRILAKTEPSSVGANGVLYAKYQPGSVLRQFGPQDLAGRAVSALADALASACAPGGLLDTLAWS